MLDILGEVNSMKILYHVINSWMVIKEFDVKFYGTYYVADIVAEYNGKTQYIVTDGEHFDDLMYNIKEACEAAFWWAIYDIDYSLPLSSVRLLLSNKEHATNI
jgi:hypothetical protein